MTRNDRDSRENALRNAKRAASSAAAVLGILTAVGGIILIIVGSGTAVAIDAIGIILGIVGYASGSRRLGVVAIVLGLLSLLVGAGLGPLNVGGGLILLT